MRLLRAKPLTRLVDADPNWVGLYPDGDVDREPSRTGDGCRTAVMIRNPIDGGPPIHHGPLWDREGATFDTLTLSPSIKVVLGPNGCEWHGFIRNGALITCGDSK